MMKVTLPILVVAFETDFGGVVSNVRYLEYIERARYALWHRAGLQVEKTWKEFGVQGVVRRVEVDYLGFAKHEDELEIKVEASEIGKTTLILNYELTRPSDGAILMRARQTMAFLNTRWRPVRVPELYRAALTQGEENGVE
jgi:acyl-CoA thioester hydrolase